MAWKLNTLQAVLATDRILTVVMFIYNNIEWGEGAQIGFNAGDGHAFFKLPGALSDETINMDENSNVGESGVFVYRIDSKYIIFYLELHNYYIALIMLQISVWSSAVPLLAVLVQCWE